MKIIIAGAVAWDGEAAILRELSQLPSDSIIIHGDSPGADALGGRIAAKLGLSVEAMSKNKDDYAKYRKGAWKGLNERMLACGVDLVFIFHPDITASRGSKHLLELAEAAGVEVRVFAQ